MSLEGRLDDLGIREIMQIVSLSKKSGTLNLRSGKPSGTVTFLDGQVVRATSTQFPEALGQLLINAEIITLQQLDTALELQRSEAEKRRLGAILQDTFKVSAEQVETIASRQIEKIVYSFFSWNSGTFRFQIEDPVSFGRSSLNPFDFMLAKGLSSQRLVLKERHLQGRAKPGAVTDNAVLEKELNILEQQLDSHSLQMLRGMLAELDNPYIGGGIIMLMLRYASEIMNRAIVFDVRGRELVGLGQFGLTTESASADQVVRKLRLEVEPRSLFAQVLNEKRCLLGELGESREEQTLVELLGGVPRQAFLGPLVNDGRVVAILYGDNYPDESRIDAAPAFEIFLSQAGQAMEKVLK